MKFKAFKVLGLLFLLILWRPIESKPQRMLLLGSLSTIVGLVKPLVGPLIGGGLSGILKGPPQSPDFGLLVQGIEKGNGFLEEIRNNLENFAQDFKYVLIELGHEEKIQEVASLSTKMNHILVSYQDGTYSFEEYEENLKALAEEINEKLYRRMVPFSAAKSYLDRLREGMIQDKVDIVTYSVKLSLAIQDFMEHYQTAIKLLRLCSVEIKHLDKFADDLEVIIPHLSDYKSKTVHGKFLPLVQDLLEGGNETSMSGMVLRGYDTMSHLVALPEGLAGDLLGMEVASQTPLVILPTSEALVGNFTVNLVFDVNGVRKLLGASNPNKAAKFDFDIAGSDRWKLVPCESVALKNSASPDWVCILNVKENLSLTIQNVPGSDKKSTFLTELSPTNSMQIFTYEAQKRCCDLFEKPDFKGARLGVCLGLQDDFKDFDHLPNKTTSVMSVRCSGARIHLYGGESHSGQEVIIPEGTSVASLDPNQITTVKSFIVKTRCSRIFTNPDMSGDFRSVCKDIPNLGDQFLNKTISILIADKPIKLFKDPNYQGESIEVRKTMDLDLLWSPQSVKISGSV